MKNFNGFFISSKRIFWMVNFSFCIAVILLIGFVFQFDATEMLIQLSIGISMTFLLIWILGGYSRIRQNYLQRVNKSAKETGEKINV